MNGHSGRPVDTSSLWGGAVSVAFYGQRDSQPLRVKPGGRSQLLWLSVISQ